MNSIIEKIYSHIRIPDSAIDIGTANTRLYVSGIGIIADEPSMIEVKLGGNDSDKLNSYRKYPHENRSYTIFPLEKGVIVHLNSLVLLLKRLFKRCRKYGWLHPRVLACAPSDTSEKERSLITRAISCAGASKVSIVPEIMAAAIGSGLDVDLHYANMIVDIGDGITDIAIIRNGRIIKSSSIRIACSDLRTSVRNMLLQRFNFIPYPDEILRLSQAINTLDNLPFESVVTVKGISYSDNEVAVEVQSKEIVSAMKPILSKVIGSINDLLKDLPHKEFIEIMESGICLTGGGACIAHMDKLIEAKTGMYVHTAPDPIHSVINGAMQIVDYSANIKDWWEEVKWPADILRQ